MDAAPPPGAAPLQLGPLPYELAAAILLRLSPLERCQAEGTCKGWKQFLRAPALWAELVADDAQEELEAAGLDPERGLKGLLVHAGAGLRSLMVKEQYALMGEQEDYTMDVLRLLMQHCAQLERLHMPQHETEDDGYLEDELQELLAMAQLVAQLPRLREVDLGSAHIDRYVMGSARAVLHTPLSCAVVKLLLSPSFINELDDLDEEANVTLDNLAAVLSACTWRCVELHVPVCRVDAVTSATLLRGFVEALQNAACVRSMHIDLVLPAEQASWVARALPAHMRIHAWQVTCTAGGANHLAAAFLPGRVIRGVLTLHGLWRAAELNAALHALSACADGAAAAGETAQLTIHTELADEQEAWTVAAAAPLAQWLHGNLSVIALFLTVDVDAVQLFIPALPASLQDLNLSCGNDAQLAALLQRLQRGELPALARLHVGTLTPARALWLRDALQQLPSQQLAEIHVCYLVPTDDDSEEGDAFRCFKRSVRIHTIMLAAPCACRVVSTRSVSWRGANPANMLHSMLLTEANAGRGTKLLRLLRDAQADLIMALHNAAAVASRKQDSHVCETTLVRLILLALCDASDLGLGDNTLDTATLNAAALRSMAMLLQRDHSSVGAALLHSLLCSAEAAQLPVAAALHDIAASCAATPQHPSRGWQYSQLALLVVCQRGAVTAHGVMLKRLSSSISSGLALLLRGAASAGELPRGIRCMSRHPGLGFHDEPPRSPEERSWCLSVAELHVDAVCAYAPEALTDDVAVREALLALLQSCSRRFLDAFSLDCLEQDQDNAEMLSRCADAYTRCINLLQRADAASNGRLDLAPPLRAARRELNALRDAFPRALGPPMPRTLHLAGHAHPLGLTADAAAHWPRMLRHSTANELLQLSPSGSAADTACDLCDLCGCMRSFAWRCTAGCAFDCCAACAATLAPADARWQINADDESAPLAAAEDSC